MTPEYQGLPVHDWTQGAPETLAFLTQTSTSGSIIPGEPQDENLSPSSHSSQMMALMAVEWAKQYYSMIWATNQANPSLGLESLNKIDITEFDEQRSRIVSQLLQMLNVAGEIAWNKIEAVLGDHIQSHQILLKLIEKTEIIQDTCQLYRKTIEAYAQYEYPSRLSVLVGRDIISVRRKYSSINALFLAVLAMEFHYVGRILLDWIPLKSRSIFILYFKAVEDYLHAPLGEVYALAGTHQVDSEALIAVQQLLSQTTTIAHTVYKRVCHLHPGYRSMSGHLVHSMVYYSSIRDVELFQIYLCLSALEGNLRPIQDELFPICAILYPRLNVSWKLVQDMLKYLLWELYHVLLPENFRVFLPYVHALTEMFSDQVVY
ncbi:conserved hypothetical protein [Planktothrix serta PCC 8927]|uniref:Uncharacterized protein n=1 Tax=Planktothrix serta PCC 8927 TaxID=671068 RepID=A0A7Z9BU10_9CYAN|nr:hypothetical protein [Planktothrix serta]VXD22534.1 conserved hypothetical protein [Planktothrix serta PCC 8927]